jgi:quinol monooxygenase YgiN
MWIQIIRVPLKPGKDAELASIVDQLQAIEQQGSGLVRSTLAREQNNPNNICLMVAFESEDAARAREQDPRRQEGLEGVRKTMSEIFAGPPEFTDLEVISEHSGT